MTNDKDEAGVHIPPTDPRLPRAQRYAEAITVAAAANERIEALKEALTVSEYRREEAESQLSSIKWDQHLGSVYTVDDPEPDANFLIDLYSGAVWERMEGSVVQDERWKKHTADFYGSLSGWPIDSGGPFAAFQHDWDLQKLVEKSQDNFLQLEGVRNAIRDLDGFADPDASSKWSSPRSMAEATKRVVRSLKENAEEERKKALEADLVKIRAERELADKQVELLEELEAALGSNAMRPLAAALKASKNKPLVGSVHATVKAAEFELLQDIEVPEDGSDPVYKPEPLLTAAALLVRAAETLLPEEKAETK